jgi:curli biogenesis system outer membrane secretion channel CsgG
MKVLVILASLLMGIVGVVQAQSSKPVVAVKTFENPPNYYNSTVGTGLTDMFITELVKTGHYNIIERAQVGQLLDEVDFGKSGYVEQQSAVKKGHIKGVQYYFLAKVTNFGASDKSVGAGGFVKGVFGGTKYKEKEAHVRIDYRIIDATSGETIDADYGEAKYSKKGVSFGGGSWGDGGGALDISSNEFRASMVGQATIMAMNNIIEKMDHSFLGKHESRAEELVRREEDAQREALEALRKVPGQVMAVVSRDLVIINLGSSNGLREGDRLLLIKNKDITNAEGQVVYTEEIEAGSMIVFEVQSDRAKAKMIDGDTPKEGDTVKIQ